MKGVIGGWEGLGKQFGQGFPCFGGDLSSGNVAA